jgi:plasmid rolling circle replication initiator protein Rep
MHTDFNTSILDTQEEILDKFLPKKVKSQYLSMLYHNLGDRSRSIRVLHCGDTLEFALSENEHKLFYADFCKDRFCPMCLFRRSLKIFGQVSACMDELDKDKDGFEYLFLTLTIKNPAFDDLGSALSALKDGFSRLLHRKVFREVVCGGFYSIEITFNQKRMEFHPHIHSVLAVRKSYFGKRYLSQAKWCDIWQECLQVDYLPIVHIERVKGLILDDLSVDYKSVVAEVAKYSVKDKDYLVLDDVELSERILSKLLDVLNHRKLCGFWGCFADVRKSLRLDDVENGDLVQTDIDPIRTDVASLIVTYHWSGGMYEVVNMGSNSALATTSGRSRKAGRAAGSSPVCSGSARAVSGS